MEIVIRGSVPPPPQTEILDPPRSLILRVESQTACVLIENQPLRLRNNSALSPPGDVIAMCVQSTAPMTRGKCAIL